jgi:tetratricopeptide (TPR) repeat protein
VISVISGVAGNLTAAYLQTSLQSYSRWVWLSFGITSVLAVVIAIIEARKRLPAETSIVEKSEDRPVTREQIVYQIQPAINPTTNALHQLRPPVNDFVGRDQEIETLVNALRNGPRASITSINGMAGIGKTELALLVADRVLKDYPDAQFFINLFGTEDKPRPPAEVMAVCIRAFRGPEASLPEDLDQLSQLYRSELSGKRVLLLLDNAADSAQVLPLLPPAGSALMVTSRRTIVLPGLTPLTLNPLTDKDARDLLLEISPRAEAAAEQICKFCGYLPLAIRAAGGLLAITPDLDPVDYAEQLKDERNRFEHLGQEGVQIGVAASLNLSYERLTPEAARVFRLLSVFPGTFDAAAAEAVCDDQSHASLSDLVRRSLVLYDNKANRYRLHDLARLFADAKLSATERTVGQKRHATHYRDVLITVDDLYLQGGHAMAGGLALFDLEWANIQAGHAWVSAHDIEADKDIAVLAMSYPHAGLSVIEWRLHSRERIRWLEIALAAAQQLKERAHESSALGNLGNAYAGLGEFNRAIQFFEQALLIARDRGDRKSEGAGLTNLGNVYSTQGETKRAIQFFEQALVIDRELGDRRGEGADLGNLGVAYKNLGETNRAIQFYEQQLTIVRELGDRRSESGALGNLGTAYAILGNTKRAIQFYQQQLTIVRELGDRRGEAISLWNMSIVLDELGDRDQAIQHAEESLIIRQEIEDPGAAKVREQLVEWRDGSALK